MTTIDFNKTDADEWKAIATKIENTAMDVLDDACKDTCTQIDASWRLRVNIMCKLFEVESVFEDHPNGPSSAWELRFKRGEWSYDEIRAFLVGALDWDLDPPPAQVGRSFTLVSIYRDGDMQWVARQFWGMDI